MDSSRHIGEPEDQQALLLRIAEDPGTPRRVSQRVKMVLDRIRGRSFAHIGQALGVAPRTVSRWCRQYRESGIAGLWDAARSGRPKTINDDAADRVAGLVKVPPADGERWTVRRVAQKLGISVGAVGRLWKALGIHQTNRGASTPGLAACAGSAVPRMRRAKEKLPRYEVCECNCRACPNCSLRRYFTITDMLTRAWHDLVDQGGVLLITLTYRASDDMTGAGGLQRARRHWRALKARWRRRWGAMPEHLQSLQWTEQGVPHRHVLIPYRGAWHCRQLRKWLVSAWTDVTGEMPPERGRQYFVHLAHRRSAHRTICYALDDVWHPVDEVAPQGVGRYRRWSTSRGWRMA